MEFNSQFILHITILREEMLFVSRCCILVQYERGTEVTITDKGLLMYAFCTTSPGHSPTPNTVVQYA